MDDLQMVFVESVQLDLLQSMVIVFNALFFQFIVKKIWDANVNKDIFFNRMGHAKILVEWIKFGIKTKTHVNA